VFIITGIGIEAPGAIITLLSFAPVLCLYYNFHAAVLCLPHEDFCGVLQ
jgi:hypothetical protein